MTSLACGMSSISMYLAPWVKNKVVIVVNRSSIHGYVQESTYGLW